MSNPVPLFLMLGSPLQLLVIVLILLLLFGAGRLGDVGKGLGEGIRNFKKGIGGGEDDKPKPKPPQVSTNAANENAANESAPAADAESVKTSSPPERG